MSASDRVKPSKRGLFTILALLGVGLLFLSGLYLTAYFSTSPEYRAAEAGVPAQTIRVATLDNLYVRTNVESLIQSLQDRQIDVLLLQRISREDAQRVAHALGMKHQGELQMYFTPTDERGNAILSRHPLYKGRSIPRPGYPAERGTPPPDGFGVWAELVIGGKRMLVGSVQWTEGAQPLEMQALINAWRRGGAIPLLLGAATEGGGQNGELVTIKPDVDAAFQGAAFYVSPHWRGTPRPLQTIGGPFVIDLSPANPESSSPLTPSQEGSR